MWKRRILKKRAKKALKSNYWRCLLAAMLLATIVGGASSVVSLAGSGATAGATAGAVAGSDYVTVTGPEIPEEEIPDSPQEVLDLFNQVLADDEQLSPLASLLEQFGLDPASTIILVFLGVIVIALVVAFLFQILIINPLTVGCYFFFARNCKEKTKLGSLAEGFECGYGHVVKGMFLKDLFLFFWTLLLIIPGIIKTYSYRLVPYILADQPELRATEAITLSRRMMKGNKWRAFVLDLSFILWYLLSILTLGILHFFFVRPYVQCTNAELYQALKEEGDGYEDEYDDDDEPEPAPDYDVPPAPAQTYDAPAAPAPAYDAPPAPGYDVPAAPAQDYDAPAQDWGVDPTEGETES